MLLLFLRLLLLLTSVVSICPPTPPVLNFHPEENKLWLIYLHWWCMCLFSSSFSFPLPGQLSPGRTPISAWSRSMFLRPPAHKWDHKIAWARVLSLTTESWRWQCDLQPCVRKCVSTVADGPDQAFIHADASSSATLFCSFWRFMQTFHVN